MALPKGEAPRVSGEIAPCSADVPCRPYLEKSEKNEKNVEPSNDNPGGHTPPPPARRRGSTAAHPPPFRRAHGSGPPRPAHSERHAQPRPPLRLCIAPRLGSAGYSASTRGVFWSSTTKELSFSSAMRALSLPSSSSMRGLSAFSRSLSNQHATSCGLNSK